MKTIPKHLTELSEARQLEREQIERDIEERKVTALESIDNSLILISNHLENISAHLLRKR